MSEIEEILRDLKHREYRERCKAIDKLRGFKEPKVVSALLNLLGEHDPTDDESRVNMRAGKVLVEMGEYSLNEHIGALKKNPSHPHDGWRRYWVARSLGLREIEEIIMPLIEVLKLEEDKEAIEGAVDALQSLDMSIGLGGYKEKVLFALKELYEKRFKHEDIYVSHFIKEEIKNLEFGRSEIKPHYVDEYKWSLFDTLSDIFGRILSKFKK